MATMVNYTCGSSFPNYTQPCAVRPILLSSLTNKQIQTQEMFMWVMTCAVFLGLLFLSFMVTHVKSERIKKAKAKLAILDVNPGLKIYKNPDGAKLVQKKRKNIPGGSATVVILIGIIVLVAYVLATEFDQPGELGFQRKLTKGIEGRISFNSTSLEDEKFVLSPKHNLDIGFTWKWRDGSPTDLHFVSATQGTCIPIIQHRCGHRGEWSYISTTLDYWKTPVTTDFVLCGNLPRNRTANDLSFYLLSEPVGDGTFRVPATVFDESLKRWGTSSPPDLLPRFEISLTAVTAFQLSVLLVDYLIVPPLRIHKVRFDSIVTKENITFNACSNPIAQFSMIGDVWEINGVYSTGLSTVVISAIGAAGTLFSTRTSIKSVFECFQKQYKASTKKRKAMTITGYAIQTFFGAIAPAGIFVGILYLFTLFERQLAPISPGKAITFVCIVIGLIWLYWIFSTVVFIRNMREFNKTLSSKNSGVEATNGNNESIDYVRLDEHAPE